MAAAASNVSDPSVHGACAVAWLTKGACALLLILSGAWHLLLSICQRLCVHTPAKKWVRCLRTAPTGPPIALFLFLPASAPIRRRPLARLPSTCHAHAPCTHCMAPTCGPTSLSPLRDSDRGGGDRGRGTDQYTPRHVLYACSRRMPAEPHPPHVRLRTSLQPATPAAGGPRLTPGVSCARPWLEEDTSVCSLA